MKVFNIIGLLLNYFLSKTKSVIGGKTVSFIDDYLNEGLFDFDEIEKKELVEVNKCINCGNCLLYCPVIRNKTFEKYPGPRNVIISSLRLENLSFDLDDFVYYCANCGICEQVCPRHLRIRKGILLLRKKFNDYKNTMLPQAHKAMYQNILKSGNIYGIKNESNSQGRNAEYVLFVGCVSKFREIDLVESSVKLLEEINVNFSLIDEVCCGGIGDILGMNIETTLAKENIDKFERIGAKKVITLCPRCYITFKSNELYKNSIESFFILDFFQNFGRRLKKSVKVTYHDPCDLGRELGYFETPRKIIKNSGANLVEMEYNKECSFCCGSGGGLRGFSLPLSIKIARNRLKMALATNADFLLTECPSCLHNLKNSKKRKDNIRIMSITQYLYSL